MREERNNKVLLNISATLIASIVSIGITMFSLKSESEFIQVMFIILLICLSLIVVAIYLYIAAVEFKENREQYKRTQKDLELFSVLPRLFVFKNRIDKFTVFDNGNAELEMDLKLEKETDNNIEFINLPVMCERKDNNTSMDFVSVTVKELCFNGEKRNNATYELKSINCGRENDRALEQGCVHVPLYSSARKGEIIRLKITLLFKDMFCEYRSNEFVIVDIPYITENMSLVVKPQSNNKRIEVTNNYFNVHEMNGENTDVEEQAKQRKNCLPDSNSLKWKTKYPKLGYRYVFSFKLIDCEEVKQ